MLLRYSGLHRDLRSMQDENVVGKYPAFTGSRLTNERQLKKDGEGSPPSEMKSTEPLSTRVRGEAFLKGSER